MYKTTRWRMFLCLVFGHTKIVEHGEPHFIILSCERCNRDIGWKIIK